MVLHPRPFIIRRLSIDFFIQLGIAVRFGVVPKQFLGPTAVSRAAFASSRTALTVDRFNGGFHVRNADRSNRAAQDSVRV